MKKADLYKKINQFILNSYTPEDVLKTTSKEMLKQLNAEDLLGERFSQEDSEHFIEVFKEVVEDLKNFLE